MRGASKTWKGILESGTTELAICESELPLDLAMRFQSLTSLDLTQCTSVTPEGLERLEAMPLEILALRIGPEPAAFEPGPQGLAWYKRAEAPIEVSRGLARAIRGLSFSRLDLVLGSRGAQSYKYIQEWLQCFAGLPVVFLELEKVAIVPNSVEPIRDMSLLTSLTLSAENLWGRVIHDSSDYLLPLLRGKPLTVLNLENCYHFGYQDSGFESFRGMPLTDLRLDMYETGCVTDMGFENLRGLPLEFLQIQSSGGTLRVTDSGLETTLRGMPLTSLTLQGMKDVTGRGLRGLLGAPLTALNLFTSDLSGDPEQGGWIPNLKGLLLTDLNVALSQITDAGLECLRGLPLVTVDLVGCRKLTGAGFSAFKDAPLHSLLVGTPNMGSPDSVFVVGAEALGRTEGLVRWEDGDVLERIVGSNEEGFVWEEGKE